MLFQSVLAVASLAGLVMAAPTNDETLTKRQTYSGEVTYYYQNGVAGSCGVVHSDYDYICALGNYWMNGEYKAPYCGDQITITNGAGTTITVTVADTCEACDETHIDLSEGAFEALGPLSEGVIPVTWHFD